MSQLRPKPDFPFSAVVGQAQFKAALILLAINPVIGGVLISGPRGSAKSTLARGLSELIASAPSASESISTETRAFVTLPLGTSEEMLIGTLDLQQVLNKQEVTFKPGLLSKAHGGVLYVDEVNLLSDPLADLLLDVAASGVNYIERDGVSHVHDASFLLVGTMNPDEGELRPQLQDRFGLAVELDNQYSIEERIEIVRRREAFDLNPRSFLEEYAPAQNELLTIIRHARTCLRQIGFPELLRVQIAERCHAECVDGLRADIIWYRAALAHAAWRGRAVVEDNDIESVAGLVLCRRRRPIAPQRPGAPPRSDSPAPKTPQKQSNHSERSAGDWGRMEPIQQNTAKSRYLDLSRDTLKEPANSIMETDASGIKGPFSARTSISSFASKRPHWFRTLIANSGQWPPTRLIFKKAYRNGQRLHFILLDTSASTLAKGLFSQAKAVVLGIAEQAYLARERVAILVFGNQKTQLLLPQSRAPKQIRKLLDATPAGGGTPLREGLLEAKAYCDRIKRHFPALQLRNYLITDGRSTQHIADIQLPGEWILIDTEQSAVKRGRGREFARDINAQYLPLSCIR